MNTTRKATRIERKQDVQVINEVLDVLNHVNTSVVMQDNKYIVSQGNEKKYEITISKIDTVIRAFNGDVPGGMRVVFKEGINVKAKLWLLKFALQEATEPKTFEQFANKVKSVKSDIDLINNMLTILGRDETRVEVLNETAVTKIYKVSWAQACTGSIVFNGGQVMFWDSVQMQKDGYIGWKLDVLRKELDKKIKVQEKAQTRAIKKQHRAQKRAETMMNLRRKLAERVFGDNSL